MFKFMKQGISLAAAVAAAGSCIPVYAAGIQPRTSIQAPDGTGNTETGNGEERNGTSITIDKAVEGHRYKVYQVFKGKVSADGTKLSNVEYGANYSGREGVELKDELAQLEAEGVEAKAFAETVRDLLKGEPAAVLSAENQTAELEAGYYMILDETLYEVDGDSLSDYIVTVAGNVTVQPKSTGVPEFDKSIDDEENPENPDNSEPENPVLPEPEVSPEVADIDWHYTLHEDTGVITLNSYIGSNPDVKVYSHYKTNITGDKVYKAELASNYLEWSEDFNKLYMFCNNQMVESVVFSDALDTSTCTDMSSMFYNCRKLTNIDFGLNFNTKNVVNMKGMFQDCDSLVNLDLKSFDTRNLNNLEVMFQNCSSLTSVDLTSFDTRRVNYMKFMFDGCTSLISADLSSFSNPYLVDATAMFSRCGNLSSVKFGADFNAGRCSKTASMFYNCASLIELDLSGFKTQDLREMTSMFAGCTNLRSVNFGSEFYTGKVFDMSSLFNGCSSLENVDVTGFNTELVTNMNGVFYGCSSLTSLNLENFDTSKCSDMRNMFRNCTNLKTITATQDKWVTKTANIGYMFTGCGTSKVTLIAPQETAAFSSILPEVSASGLTEEDAAPDEYIEIEDDDTSVEYGIGDSIHYKLTATMPESITAYKKYQLAFHDKLSAGLDYDRDSLRVFAGDTEISAEHYTVAYSEDGKSMTVSIADVKAAPWNAVPGTQIIVKYSAVLNENAQAGNTNEAFLEYSNDPKGEGTGTTGPGVPDTVTVYTFELRFDKVDKNGNALEGAGFTLYKKNDAGEFVPASDEIKGVTRFSFKGLAAGEYKLVETTTPDGYNTMEDLCFNIVAEEAESGGETVKRISIEAPDGSPLSGWTAIGADKAFESDIANYTGSTLPETGGVGTYLLYAAGVAVVITAGTVIAARKKADEE